jgi:uncharacterized protein YjbJ (UPF0337 family)
MPNNDGEKIKGTAQNLKGKIKEGVGELINNEELANKGRAEQVVGKARVEGAKAAERGKGKLEEIGGKVKGAVGDLIDNEQLEAEGKIDEAKGKARQKLND